MILIDAQLSPMLAAWITQEFGIEAHAVREFHLQESDDLAVFHFARGQQAIVVTKDGDFVRLLEESGPPPHVIWLTCGNTSNAHVKQILAARLRDALQLIAGGEPLVEISGE